MIDEFSINLVDAGSTLLLPSYSIGNRKYFEGMNNQEFVIECRASASTILKWLSGTDVPLRLKCFIDGINSFAYIFPN